MSESHKFFTLSDFSQFRLLLSLCCLVHLSLKLCSSRTSSKQRQESFAWLRPWTLLWIRNREFFQLPVRLGSFSGLPVSHCAKSIHTLTLGCQTCQGRWPCERTRDRLRRSVAPQKLDHTFHTAPWACDPFTPWGTCTYYMDHYLQLPSLYRFESCLSALNCVSPRLFLQTIRGHVITLFS